MHAKTSVCSIALCIQIYKCQKRQLETRYDYLRYCKFIFWNNILIKLISFQTSLRVVEMKTSVITLQHSLDPPTIQKPWINLDDVLDINSTMQYLFVHLINHQHQGKKCFCILCSHHLRISQNDNLQFLIYFLKYAYFYRMSMAPHPDEICPVCSRSYDQSSGNRTRRKLIGT